ncbi:hypothetical protein [Metallibacterium sp.]|jgi:hypothetical protein|nr:hypothetical protein [Metallibacterium sp.]
MRLRDRLDALEQALQPREAYRLLGSYPTMPPLRQRSRHTGHALATTAC